MRDYERESMCMRVIEWDEKVSEYIYICLYAYICTYKCVYGLYIPGLHSFILAEVKDILISIYI